MAVTKLHRSLYVQVLIAILIGILIGYFFPETGAEMKPLGDGFIKLIKMIIAPIIFCTVVSASPAWSDMKEVGQDRRDGPVYFEVVSTLALIVGLVVVNVVKPGAGMNVDPAALDASAVAEYTSTGQMHEHARFPAQRHSRRASSTPSPRATSCRCCCSRSCSVSRCTRSAGAAAAFDFIERVLPRPVRDRRHHHEARAPRRLRRDGLHHRQLRLDTLVVARQAHGYASTRLV